MEGIIEKKFKPTIYESILFWIVCGLAIYCLYATHRMVTIKQIPIELISSILFLIVAIVKLIKEVREVNEKVNTLEISEKGVKGFRNNQIYLIEWKYIVDVTYEVYRIGYSPAEVFLIIIVNDQYKEETDICITRDDNPEEKGILLKTTEINTKKACKIIKENLQILK